MKKGWRLSIKGSKIDFRGDQGEPWCGLLRDTSGQRPHSRFDSSPHLFLSRVCEPAWPGPGGACDFVVPGMGTTTASATGCGEAGGDQEGKALPPAPLGLEEDFYCRFYGFLEPRFFLDTLS